MPKYEVTGPDGKRYEVTAPEGATEAQIIDRVKSQAQPRQTQTPQQFTPEQPTTKWGRFSQGIADIPTGIATTIANTGVLGKGVKDTMNAYEQAYFGPSAGGKIDPLRLTGNLISGAGLAYMTPAIAPETVLGAVGTGALSGAIGGMATPVAKGGKNFWGDKLKQMGIGAAVGGVTSGVLGTVGRALSPKVDPQAQKLMNEGVRLTPGQIAGDTASRFEQKAQDFVPFVAGARMRGFDDLNKAAYNRVLAAIDPEKTFQGEVGRSGIESLQKTVSGTFNKALSNAKFIPDEQFSAELANLKTLAQDMPEREADIFNKLLKRGFETFVGKGNGSMDGKTIQVAERKLRDLATTYSKSSDPTAQEFLGGAFKEAHRIFDDAIMRQNPQSIPLYNSAKTAYSLLKRVEDASNMAGSVNGKFTPDALMSAVRSGAAKFGSKAKLAAGEAAMQDLAEAGKAIMGNSVPNSGTPQRLITQAATLGGAGALGVINTPAAIGLGAVGTGSLLYTTPGQRAAQYIMAGSRSPFTQGAGDLLRRSAVPIGVGSGLLLSSP